MAEQEHFTNFRCLLFGTGFAMMGAAFGAQISGWTHWITIGLGYGIGSVLMLIAILLIARSFLSRQSESSTSQASGTVPGIPTLSGLLGQNPALEFNAKQFLAQAYYSPVTAEAEKNIKIIAQQYAPDDREGFYARFVGVGIVRYQHDVTWFTIYGSQLAALAELNSRGVIPIGDLRKHYEKAVADYPKSYESYSFEKWVDYMQSRALIAKYPSEMVELSFGGRDFLSYIAHVGYNANGKPN